jgi:colanic acid biosynthesis glycosyl transferase WcaI
VNLSIHDYAGHIAQCEAARALAERGHRVHFTYCDELPTPRGDLAPAEAIPGFTIEPIGIGRSIIKQNYFVRQWQDVQYARQLVRNLRRQRPDVVLSSNNPLIPQWALVRHCRRRGIPVIHWWADIYSLAVKHGVGNRFGPLGKLIACFYEQLEVRLLKQSQAVLAITPQFRAIADAWDVKTRFVAIPVAAPTERLLPCPKRNVWSERYGLADTMNVVYSGTLGNKHHPELLYELAASFVDRPERRVIVVAGGVGADLLAQQQAERPLPNLVLLPFQPYEDYANVLATGDVHVTTLNAEASAYALPSKVMSQLCAGRAQVAIVPRDNDMGRLVAAAGAGEVYPAAEFAEARGAIDRLLDDPEQRDRYARAGRSYAENHLSIAALAPRYEELLRAVAPGKVDPSATTASEPSAAFKHA